jgi:hypothetical protein
MDTACGAADKTNNCSQSFSQTAGGEEKYSEWKDIINTLAPEFSFKF